MVAGKHIDEALFERIALGDWAKKDEVVVQWISRASALAEEMIEAGEVQTEQRAAPFPAGSTGWHSIEVIAG